MCRVVTVSKVPGSAEVSRGVPRLRGTVSGCPSHTKVFHRGREHAKLLTIANGRRRSKAVTEPAAASARRPLVGWDPRRARTVHGPIPWLRHRLLSDPGRPLSPLLSFVSHIFDSASDRASVGASDQSADFMMSTSRPRELPLHPPYHNLITHLMDRGLAWTCRSCLAH